MITIRTGNYTPIEIKAIPNMFDYFNGAVCMYCADDFCTGEVTDKCPYKHLKQDLHYVTKDYKK